MIFTDAKSLHKVLGDAVQRASGVSVYPDPPSVRKWSENIKALSDTFNSGSGTKKIYSVEDALNAYCIYFLPCNIIRMMALLDSVYKENQALFNELLKKERIVLWDVGCGPASASFAYSLKFSETAAKTDFVLSDVNKGMLDRAGRVMTGKKFRTIAHSIGCGLPQLNERPDIIIMANVINETAEEFCIEPFLNLGAELIIFMEPALINSSRRLLRLRDKRKKGYDIIYPCTTQNPCPALAQKDNWCHMSVKWERPPWIMLLDRQLGFNKTELDYTPIVLSNNSLRYSKQGCDYRVVSDMSKKKWGKEIFVCGSEGLIKKNGIKAKRGDRLQI